MFIFKDLIGHQAASVARTKAEVQKKCHRQKSFWKFAKRLMNFDRGRKSAKSATVASTTSLVAAKTVKFCSTSTEPEVIQHLHAPVLLSVFEYLPLLDRIRLRMVRILLICIVS